MSAEDKPRSGFIQNDGVWDRQKPDRAEHEDQFAPALEAYRLEWERGVYRSVIDAFELCALNGLRMPPWLSLAVISDLFYAYQNRKRGEEEYSRNGERQDLEAHRHLTRYRVVKTLLDHQAWEITSGVRKKLNKDEAGREASQLLKEDKSGAWASKRLILASYELVAAGVYQKV